MYACIHMIITLSDLTLLVKLEKRDAKLDETELINSIVREIEGQLIHNTKQ